MPVQKPLPDGHHDAVLVHHRKPLLSGGADGDVKEEEEVVVAVEAERPMCPTSLSLAAEERRQVLDVAGEEDSDCYHEAEEELPEYVYIDLKEIRKEVQCPICLGIIKKTRTVMECLHRFCRECIDKSMRMGNNECPACRTHCASRRSLRDDPRHDALITALFPDIEKYEEEELALCEEEKTRNKQIQASIAQIFKRQSEALGKKRSSWKGSGVPSPSRSQRSNRETPSRRRKRRRSGKTELEESDYDEDLEITEGQTSSYSGEHFKEIDQHRPKTRRQPGSSFSLSPATSSDGGCIDDKLEQKRSYPGIMWNIEMLAWGRGAARSNTRHGSANGQIRKNFQSTRLHKLIEFLRNIEKKDDEHVASETSSGADKNLLESNKCPQGSFNKQGRLHMLSDTDDKGRLCNMSEEKKTLAGLQANCISRGGQLMLACQQKEAL